MTVAFHRINLEYWSFIQIQSHLLPKIDGFSEKSVPFTSGENGLDFAFYASMKEYLPT